MNSEQAKKLSLPDILSKLGHQPVNTAKGGREVWYLSPFRLEKEPSFHTSFLGGKWIWNDFGDIGGTVIDFVMRYQSYTNVSQALAFLDKMYLVNPYKPVAGNNKYRKNHLSFQQQRHEEPPESALKLDRVEPIRLMLPYITGVRKIAPAVAKRYLLDVHFVNLTTGKKYFAAGIANRAGGYEIRNPFFKSSIGKKDITLIKGQGATASILAFEGFIDFLSYLTDKNLEAPAEDVVILNSASFGKAAMELIEQGAYLQIFTFFDNDKAGQGVTESFQDKFGEDKVRAINNLYRRFRDYNEMISNRFGNKNEQLT
ncbi:MAG: toprim domain-containing protein [Saprospiraceae bacterium]